MRFVPSAKSVLRAVLEVAVALFFVVVAAETYAHRSFDPDPRYRLLMSAVAVLLLWFGLIPLLHHASPRLGKGALLGWVVGLVALGIVGLATRP